MPFVLSRSGMNNNNNNGVFCSNTTSSSMPATISKATPTKTKTTTKSITTTITTTSTTKTTEIAEAEDVTSSRMIDIEIAKDMNQLSVTEREQLLEEIHGVAGTMEETPEFLKQCMKDMDDAISKVPRRKRKAMDRVHFLRPTALLTNNYNSKKWKLWFLRADNYDANLAARRLAAFYEYKLNLFGEDKICNDITLDDLTSQENEENEDAIKLAFQSGAIGILPHKDQSGRPVMFTNPSNWNFNLCPKILIRVRWYLAMMLLHEDEAASIKGLCHVIYATKGRISSTASISRIADLAQQSRAMLAVFPTRIMSIHFCSNNRNPGMVSKFLSNIGKQKRLRLRVHCGSPLEMEYSLLTIGIRCNGFLFDNSSRNNNNSNDNNNNNNNNNNSSSSNNNDTTTAALNDFVTNTLTRRREIEAEQEMIRKQTEITSGIIRYPQENDVLIGRGSSYTEFTGNRRFHQIIESQLETYIQTHLHKFDKTCISMSVVKSIQATGGRFLVKNDVVDGDDDGISYWKVLDDIQARDKTSTAFRSRNSNRSKQLQQQKQQQQQQQHEEYGVVGDGDDDSKGSHTNKVPLSSPSSSGLSSSSMLKQQLRGSRTPIKQSNKRLRRNPQMNNTPLPALR